MEYLGKYDGDVYDTLDGPLPTPGAHAAAEPEEPDATTAAAVTNDDDATGVNAKSVTEIDSEIAELLAQRRTAVARAACATRTAAAPVAAAAAATAAEE